LKRLDQAFKGFFRRVAAKKKGAGFPRFRGKSWWKSFSFSEPKGFSFDGARLRFKGMPGRLRVHVHRSIPTDGRVRTCTICRDTKGWKIGFAVTFSTPPAREGQRGVGVDLGLQRFAALSDGGFIPSLRAARRAERRLRIAHRSLDRKKRGSKKRAQQRRRLARCYAGIARQRSNHLHQASARMIRDYDVVAIEALNVRGLARGFLSRQVLDASWTRFVSMLRYKAERAGARIVEVDPRGSSQECSNCGVVVSKMLDDRWHDCPNCGLSIDRDLNAARNIFDRAGVGPGLRNVAGRGGKRAGGRLDNPLNAGC
jgi:putative transposase